MESGVSRPLGKLLLQEWMLRSNSESGLGTLRSSFSEQSIAQTPAQRKTPGSIMWTDNWSTHSCAVAYGILLLLLVQTHGQDPASPIRTTRLGQVRGSLAHVKGTDAGVHTFLGLPFAKPPLGPLRFAPPKPPEAWSGVKDATSHPNSCLQNVVETEGLLQKLQNRTLSPSSMSEDCLYLNIYTPAHAREGSNLPVMVWIHGGALVTGMASTYDGSALAAFENVVVVIIQYRLGVLGFFSTGDGHAPGNWGYLDQVAALRWVQQNIASFGGNPDRVTLFGASAGSTSVSSHVVSPMSKGLFHGAIMESGVALTPGLIASSSDVVSKMVAERSGCGQVDSEALVRCLRHKSKEDMLTINEPFKIIAGVVDGTFLPRHPQELLRAADFRPVPSIIGINNDEYGWLIPKSLNLPENQREMDRETMRKILEKALTMMALPPKLDDLLMDEYMGDSKDPEAVRAQFHELMADSIFVIPSLQVAKLQSSRAPVYFYEFQHRPSYLKDTKPPYVKADHGDEVPFVFGTFAWTHVIEFTEQERALSRQMMKYWANFARQGNPNSENLLTWPELDNKEQYLQLNLQPALGQALKASQFRFWTKTLPRRIEELIEAQKKHKEL